jgi:hypothetical protein
MINQSSFLGILYERGDLVLDEYFQELSFSMLKRAAWFADLIVPQWAYAGLIEIAPLQAASSV